MNIQLSLTANSTTVGQSKNELTPSTEVTSPVVQAPIIRNIKDMSSKENQGINVSVAEEQLIRTIERAVKSLQGPQTTLQISIHEKTHDIMVKVLNKDTGELIREVPPEKTLDLVANMMEIAGILIDEKI
jgi:flagellar protein FlaG